MIGQRGASRWILPIERAGSFLIYLFYLVEQNKPHDQIIASHREDEQREGTEDNKKDRAIR